MYRGEETILIDPNVAPRSPEQTIEALRQQLRQAERLIAMGTMTAMVVHEFNNILTPIVNYAQLAQRNPKMTEKALSHAITDGKRAAEICRALLGMTKHNPELETFRLRDVIDDTLTAMARDPKRDGIELTVRLPDDLELTLRKAEFQQVILNLILNARAAVLERPAPRRIEIDAHASAETLELRVADNGVGIRTENLEKIFDPFFTTKTDGPANQHGNGLGLAFCRDVLEGMGGTISVQSTPGIGTAFSLRLPK